VPLSSGYGVVVGSLHRYYPDPAEGYGDYFHANVEVLTPRGVYRCLLDVDDGSAAGLLWRVVELGATDLNGVALKGVASLPDDWHPLDSTRNSGALDYLRTPELAARAGTPVSPSEPTPDAERGDDRAAGNSVWRRGTRQQALADLERLLQGTVRVFVYGEPFTRGRGVHNVHQNQGDPPGSVHAEENGVWQDGALVVRRQSGSFAAYLTKYATQAARTDKRGRPM
jgi:hypothetical protein